eukprot:scaffold51630_cov64-Phaeocystis_antarctica.AAC.6
MHSARHVRHTCVYTRGSMWCALSVLLCLSLCILRAETSDETAGGAELWGTTHHSGGCWAQNSGHSKAPSRRPLQALKIL